MTKRSRPIQPNVYIIAGPNGAGKTTFASQFLPDFVKCREFLNADLIAAGLSPFAPETQSVRAGRLLLERLRELSAERTDFGFETTLSGRTYLKRLSEMKASGFRVTLYFLWLPGVELAERRVAGRVKQGGHNIPVADIRRRYAAGLRNLLRLYRPILDAIYIYDASELPPLLVASEENGELRVQKKRRFEQIVKQEIDDEKPS